MQNIYISSDHAGFELKQNLLASSKLAILNLIDLGCYNLESVDYPDYAVKMANLIKKNPEARGVLICGSGIGLSIAANRFPFIRAALCNNVELAKLAREHNNANILVLGSRYIKYKTAEKCLDVFFHTDFLGGRHLTRVEKLDNLVI